MTTDDITTNEEIYEVAGVTTALRGAEFPISKDDLVKRYGDSKIVVDDHRVISLAECLANDNHTTFESLHEVVNAVHKDSTSDTQRNEIYGGNEQDPDKEEAYVEIVHRF